MFLILVQYYFPLNIIQDQVITFSCPEGFNGIFSRTCIVKKINKTSNIGVYSSYTSIHKVFRVQKWRLLLEYNILMSVTTWFPFSMQQIDLISATLSVQNIPFLNHLFWGKTEKICKNWFSIIFCGNKFSFLKNEILYRLPTK